MQLLDMHTLTAFSALALGWVAYVAVQVSRRGSPRARLCSLSVWVGALAVFGALAAMTLGAAQYDTGRFLIGMSVGVTLGLSLGCAIILVADRRAARRR